MNNKGVLSTKIIIIAIVFLVIVGTLIYIYFNQPELTKPETVSEEINIEDLTDDHLDDSIIELDEIDFDVYGIG